MEYFADGNKDPHTCPWSPLKCIYSVSEKGKKKSERQCDGVSPGVSLLFNPQRPEEELEHLQLLKKCSFLRKCSYKERARKSLSNIY